MDTAQSHQSQRTTYTDFLYPSATKEVVLGGDETSIDASNTCNGYINIFYNGSSNSGKVVITGPDGEQYIYNIIKEGNNTFPLSCGNGTYNIALLEPIKNTTHAVILAQDIDVVLTDEFQPFLYPNQYVWFEKGSSVAELGIELSYESADDLDFLRRVYNYVVSNIEYDSYKAEHIPTVYIPNLDETITTKKGICFDYASLMSALLRSQRIPVKLVFGYSGTVYHAWISVYLQDIGWVDNIIHFDGVEWTLIDPTLAANSDENYVKEIIGDGNHYTEKFFY